MASFICGDLARLGISGMDPHDLDSMTWSRGDLCCGCVQPPALAQGYMEHGRMEYPFGPWDDPQSCCARTVYRRDGLRVELCCQCAEAVESVDALFAEVHEVLGSDLAEEVAA